MSIVLTFKKICFYFPFNEDSGVPVLFYSLANYIALNNPETRVFVIDYKNGCMSRNIIKLKNLELITFEKNKIIKLPDESVLVMQTFVPYYWPYELKLNKNQNIFFWNLHPQNLTPSLLPLPFLRNIPFNFFIVYKILSNFYKPLIKKLNKYIEILLKHNSLYFMDVSNLNYTSKHLFIKLPEKFLPLPVSKPSTNLITKKDNIIRLGWVGRLCDFKIHILLYTLKKIKETIQSIPKTFEIHIVGDGPFKKVLEKEITKLNINSITHIHGSVKHSNLEEFISKKIDIMFAMGTSALESAKLKKPTILLDFSFKKIDKDYNFRLLKHTSKFDLGHKITSKDYVANNESLKFLLEDIISNYNLHSEDVFKYYFDNHSIEKVSELFLEYIEKSNLKFDNIEADIIKKPLILKSYNYIRKLK